MQEYVGQCKACSGSIYCHDGFIHGFVMDDQSLLCFECGNKDEQLEQDKEA